MVRGSGGPPRTYTRRPGSVAGPTAVAAGLPPPPPLAYQSSADHANPVNYGGPLGSLYSNQGHRDDSSGNVPLGLPFGNDRGRSGGGGGVGGGAEPAGDIEQLAQLQAAVEQAMHSGRDASGPR